MYSRQRVGQAEVVDKGDTGSIVRMKYLLSENENVSLLTSGIDRGNEMSGYFLTTND